MKQLQKCKLWECGKEFLPDHANLRYCSVNCKNEALRMRNKFGYDSIREFSKAAKKNLMLFELWLGEKTEHRIEYLTATAAGFDQHGFYGSYRREDEPEVCYLNEYEFFFHHSNNTDYLIIKKETYEGN